MQRYSIDVDYVRWLNLTTRSDSRRTTCTSPRCWWKGQIWINRLSDDSSRDGPFDLPSPWIPNDHQSIAKLRLAPQCFPNVFQDNPSIQTFFRTSRTSLDSITDLLSPSETPFLIVHEAFRIWHPFTITSTIKVSAAAAFLLVQNHQAEWRIGTVPRDRFLLVQP